MRSRYHPLLLLACVLLSGCGAREEVNVWEFMDGNLAGLASFTDHTTLLFSSTDRTGGNDDGFSGLYSRLRIDERGEHVLAEAEGPGCVRRIWMTWPGKETQVRVYADGEEEPRIDMPVSRLFSGREPPFLSPWVGSAEQFGGVNFSYAPIPFEKSIKITTVDGVRFYQIQIHRYPRGTNIRTVDFPPSDDEMAAILAARAAWEALPEEVAMEMPWTVELVGGEEVHEAEMGLPAGAPATLLAVDRGGEIAELRIALQGPEEAWRNVRLRARWDDEVEREGAFSVDVPLADLFGSAVKPVPVRSAAILASPMVGVLRLPMPFRRARIEAVNLGGGEPVCRMRALLRPSGPSAGDGRLHALWREEGTEEIFAGEETAPVADGGFLPVAKVRGRGHYVGTLLTAVAGGSASFLEGDDEMVVDGDTAAVLHGTGTEDYFNSGWYFARTATGLPFHGIFFRREDPVLRLSAARFHLTDRISFARSLLFGLEIPPGERGPGPVYSTVSLWYQEEPHDPGFSSTAEGYGGFLPRRIVYPPHTVLLTTEMVAGPADPIPAAPAWPSLFPGWDGPPPVPVFPEGAQPARRGEVRIHLFPEQSPPAGAYDVSLIYARAPGFGILDARLGDLPRSGPWTCHSDSAAPVTISPPRRIVWPGSASDLLLSARPGPATGIAHLAEGGVLPLALVGGILFRPAGPTVDRWLVAGPFDNPAHRGLDAVYPPEEEHAAGGVNSGAVYSGLHGEKVTWKEGDAGDDGFVDLRSSVGPGVYRVAYAVTWVHTPDARRALFSLGSDDAAVVWLNGERIWRNPTLRAHMPDDDRFTGDLEPGWNEILIKVSQGIAGWGFSLRLSDAEGELTYALWPE